ncbi:MAG TPA: VOC family protein [Ilumatobacteraceae bacterium]|nr:VOC family protein [Ilumatobacteraceae bacterium]
MPLHHVAYATRDVEATTHFYEHLMGFPLVHTEITALGESWLRHVFYEITTGDDAETTADAAGDTECIAFFELHQVGEQPGWTTDVSDGVGLPFWVNHCAFRATSAQQEAVRARMTAAGIEPAMEQDHGWCHSLYYLDPNGIMVELCRDTPGFEPDPAEAHRLLTVDPLAEPTTSH